LFSGKVVSNNSRRARFGVVSDRFRERKKQQAERPRTIQLTRDDADQLGRTNDHLGDLSAA
jgi:hypothetical protein